MAAQAGTRGLGGRIREARTDAGLSQAALATRIGVTQATISNWEAGSRQPSVQDLYVLADQLGVDIFDLLPRQGPPVRAALRAVAEKLDLVDLARDVDAFLDYAEAVDRPEATVWPRAARAGDAAQELLDHLSVRVPPIDVEAAAAACGVPVVLWDFTDENLSGLVVHTGAGAVIGINGNHAATRRRFSIGHELGHVVLSHLDSFHVDLGAAAEHGEPPGYNWRHERAANDFSAGLLMPPGLLRTAYRRTRSVDALAARFDVSELAMGFRLANLGLR